MSKSSQGFAAISHPSARILILGSLPGAVSLERGQYYANPQNVFWQIMDTLVVAGPHLQYAQRTDALTKAGIALWDVCASAHRIGSLDSAIKHHAANDFARFFAEHPQINLVCFNGQKADALYRRSVLSKLPLAFQQLSTRVLPSTSPANASVPYAEKLRQWSSILDLRHGIAKSALWSHS